MVFHNIFDLLQCPVNLMTLIIVIKFLQQTFSNKDIDIKKIIVRRVQNFIDGVSTQCLTRMSD